MFNVFKALKMFKRVKVLNYETGFKFVEGEFQGVLDAGIHRFFDPLGKIDVQVVSRREVFLRHDQLDVIVKNADLKGLAQVIDLRDDQRALVWVDDRFTRILGPGLHLLWTEPRRVRVEVIELREPQFVHADLKTILSSPTFREHLDLVEVARGQRGVLFLDGKPVGTLEPGQYAFWKGLAQVEVQSFDLREIDLEISGQEIMTADKVTLRLNALVTYRVVDPLKCALVVQQVQHTLYKDVQLAIRAAVGTRELDLLLNDKDSLGEQLAEALSARAEKLGLDLLKVGVKDIILPGEMRQLFNQVTEARKAAEANLITRREETAAIRSQLNTARLLSENPTLMRMRELELLEKLVANGKMSVILGEKGLSDRVINLL